MNMNMAFISRHPPTAEQVALAADQGFSLIHVGDADAFTVAASFVHEAAARLDVSLEAVAVVHPAAALRLCSDFIIGVFENANRADPGQPPLFFAKNLHVFDMRD